MSAVSGFATLASASALHGGRPEAVSHSKARPAGDSGTGDGAFRMDASLARAVERLQRAGAFPDLPVQNDVIQEAGPHGRFVDAVQALRLTEADASRLTPTRVAELKEAAREVFSVATGIPRAQSPIEVFEEQRLRETELRKEVPIGPPETGSAREDDPSIDSGNARMDNTGTVPDADVPELPQIGNAPEAGSGADRDTDGIPAMGGPEQSPGAGAMAKPVTAPAGPEPASRGDAGHSSTG